MAEAFLSNHGALRVQNYEAFLSQGHAESHELNSP
jgi:hypothetical protein